MAEIFLASMPVFPEGSVDPAKGYLKEICYEENIESL